MKGSVRVDNPDVVEVTVTLTMPVSDWRELIEQAPERWPSTALTRLVKNALYEQFGRLTKVQEES